MQNRSLSSVAKNKIPFSVQTYSTQTRRGKSENTNWKFTTLNNGLRVATFEKFSPVGSVALYVNAGKADECQNSSGSVDLLELSACHSFVQSTEECGAYASCKASREHIRFLASGMRHEVPMLASQIIRRAFDLNTYTLGFSQSRLVMPRQKRSLEESLAKGDKPSVVLELLNQSAWGSAEANADDFSAVAFDGAQKFFEDNFAAENCLLVAVNVSHDDICSRISELNVPKSVIGKTKRSRPVYQGADIRLHIKDSPQVHLALCLGMPTDGESRTSDILAAGVIQSLLGGGGAFSAGGPGKGMKTKLYRNVLELHPWIETCSAFYQQYSKWGLLGIYAEADSGKERQLLDIVTHQLSCMAQTSETALQRAKNSLKCSVGLNYESSIGVMDDFAEQFFANGEVLSAKEICKRIDAVSIVHLQRVAGKLLNSKPTFVAIGNDLSSVAEVKSLLSS